MIGNLSENDVGDLRRELAGDVILPGEEAYDASRQTWNLAADLHPAAVVMVESAADIAASVRFASGRDLRVAPQATGHGALSVPDLSGAIMVKASRMTNVSIDADAGSARAGAGAQWRNVVGPAGEHGLAALHGSSGTVGLAGYHAGGGHGWIGRSEGWACNHVRSFEAVTAAGEIVTASRDSEPDLFWALRGGGGAHALVTAIEIDLFEMTEAYAGGLLWDMERAGEISRAWRDITRDAPETFASTLKLARFPPFPTVPEPIRGRALVGVTFCFRGSEADGEELIAPLRAVGDPHFGQTGVMPAPALAGLAGDPEDPLPGLGFSAALDSFEDDVVDTYVELAGPGVDVPLIHLEVRHLGGALARSDATNGALDAIDSPYLLGSIGALMSPELEKVIEGTFATIAERMAPWTNERSLLGFAEHRPGWRSSFPVAIADRLAEVRDVHDPDKLIIANHDVE